MAVTVKGHASIDFEFDMEIADDWLMEMLDLGDEDIVPALLTDDEKDMVVGAIETWFESDPIDFFELHNDGVEVALDDVEVVDA